MTEQTIDLVVIGHTAIDNIIFNNYSEILPGGSGPAVAISAAENGTKVGLLTRIGSDYPRLWFETLKKYIDTTGIYVMNGKTAHIKIEYSDDENIKNISIDLNISNKFGDISFPEIYQMVTFKHICPLPIYDQLELAKKCSTHSHIVSADFNQVYESDYKNNPDIIRKIMKNVDIIFPNEFEARSITGASCIEECAKILYDMGPSIVVITLGKNGAVAYDGDKLRSYPSQNIHNIVDPTGCGDAFIGGFLDTYIKTDNIDLSIKSANAMAAKKIMKKGAWMVE